MSFAYAQDFLRSFQPSLILDHPSNTCIFELEGFPETPVRMGMSECRMREMYVDMICPLQCAPLAPAFGTFATSPLKEDRGAHRA